MTKISNLERKLKMIDNDEGFKLIKVEAQLIRPLLHTYFNTLKKILVKLRNISLFPTLNIKWNGQNDVRIAFSNFFGEVKLLQMLILSW